MSQPENMVSGVFSNLLSELLVQGISQLRRRRSQHEWADGFLDEIAKRGVKLSGSERSRLLHWVRTGDMVALRNASEGPIAELSQALNLEVFQTHDHAAAPPGADLLKWADDNRQRSEQLAGHLWSSMLASLTSDERLRLESEVASIYSLGQIQEVLLGLSETVHEGIAGRAPHAWSPLERVYLRPPSGESLSPYHLLWPRFGLVPFTDHLGALASLTEWCDSADPVSATFIDGAGGMGKTRLALELCRRMASRAWLTGLYRIDSPAGVEALRKEMLPRLVVFDYANDNPYEIASIVDRLTEIGPPRTAKLRFVLLTRPTGGDSRSWHFSSRQSRGAFRLDNAATVSLSHASTPGAPTRARQFTLDSRSELFDATYTSMSAFVIGQSTPTPAVDLTADTYASPLFVILLAVLLVFEPTAHVTDTRDELLQRILEREDGIHWQGGPEPDPTLRAQCVSSVTISASGSEATTLARLAALGYPLGAVETRRVALWLRSLYPGRAWANPLEPDLLGEFLLRGALRRELVTHIGQNGSTAEVTDIFRVLARILSTWGDGDLAQPVEAALDLLPSLIQVNLEDERFGRPGAADALDAFHVFIDLLPSRYSLPSAEMAGRLGPAGGRLAVKLIRRWIAQCGPASDPDHAHELHLRSELSRRLVDIGQWSEAYQVIQDARCLVESGPHVPLSMTRSILTLLTLESRCLLRQKQDGAPPLEEALARLARMSNGERFDLRGLEGAILFHYANAQVNVKHPHDALETLGRCISLRTGICESLGDAHLPALSATYRFRARIQLQLLQLSEAAGDVITATELLRTLAGEGSNVFDADLARCLDLGARISDALQAGREANIQAGEAIVIRRRLGRAFGYEAKMEFLGALVRRLGDASPGERGDLRLEALELALELADRDHPALEDGLRLSRLIDRLAVSGLDDGDAARLSESVRMLRLTLVQESDANLDRVWLQEALASDFGYLGDWAAMAAWGEQSVTTRQQLESVAQRMANVSRQLRRFGSIAQDVRALGAMDAVMKHTGELVLDCSSDPASNRREVLRCLGFLAGWFDAAANEESADTYRTAVVRYLDTAVADGRVRDYLARRMAKRWQDAGWLLRRGSVRDGISPRRLPYL